MVKWRAVIGATAVVAGTWATSWAVPAVQSPDANPAALQINTATAVTITAAILDPTYIAGSALVQRINPDGSVISLGAMRDDGAGGDAVAADRIVTRVVTFNEAQAGRIRLRVSAAFRGLLQRVLSHEIEVRVGSLLPTGGGGTFPGPGGTSITVQPGTFSAPVLVGIAPAALSRVVAPLVLPGGQSFTLVAAVDVIIEPVGFTGLLDPAAFPLDISVPLPAGVTDTEFVVGEQVVIDSITGTPGLRPQLLTQAVATAIGNTIVTQPSALPGIRSAGLHAIVGGIGGGVITGTVRNSRGGPAAGAVVSNNTNTGVAVTNATGQYSLFISGGPFTVTAFHPFLGTTGTATGNITVPGSTVNGIDITLAVLLGTRTDGAQLSGHAIGPDESSPAHKRPYGK